MNDIKKGGIAITPQKNKKHGAILGDILRTQRFYMVTQVGIWSSMAHGPTPHQQYLLQMFHILTCANDLETTVNNLEP